MADTPNTASDLVERVARASNPDLWRQIDEARETGRFYRGNIGKAGYQGEPTEQTAAFHENRARKMAEIDLARVQATITALEASQPTDQLAEDLGATTCPVCGKGPGHDERCAATNPADLIEEVERLREASVALAVAAGVLNCALDGQERYRAKRQAVTSAMEKLESALNGTALSRDGK